MSFGAVSNTREILFLNVADRIGPADQDLSYLLLRLKCYLGESNMKIKTSPTYQHMTVSLRVIDYGSYC
jgi:hypothetical protein